MNIRKIHVYGRIIFCRKHKMYRGVNPQIILQGNWLEQAGFNFGDAVQVDVSSNQLIISKV